MHVRVDWVQKSKKGLGRVGEREKERERERERGVGKGERERESQDASEKH